MSKGLQFERRVASWLRRMGFSARVRELVRGFRTRRSYEVDVHAWAVKGLIRKRRINIWVECKARKTRIKRNDVHLLIQKAIDVRDAFNEEIEEWYPDILMIVSTAGFDNDAISLGDHHGVYLVHKGRRYEFVGEMQLEDLLELKESDY